MADRSVIEIPKISDLAKDGPIPEDLRHRLDCDLDQVQVICLTLRKLCDAGLGEEWDVAEFATVVDAMAYRAGKLLNPWTNTGYFDDEEERRIEAGHAEEAGDGARHG